MMLPTRGFGTAGHNRIMDEVREPEENGEPVVEVCHTFARMDKDLPEVGDQIYFGANGLIANIYEVRTNFNGSMFYLQNIQEGQTNDEIFHQLGMTGTEKYKFQKQILGYNHFGGVFPPCYSLYDLEKFINAIHNRLRNPCVTAKKNFLVRLYNSIISCVTRKKK